MAAFKNRTGGAREVCVRFEGLSQPYPPNLDYKLQLYFQSSKQSGGGDIDSVNIHTQDDAPFAIIIFDDLESVQNVLAKKNHSLMIDNKKIGLLVEAGMSEDVPSHSVESTSTPFDTRSDAEDLFGNDREGDGGDDAQLFLEVSFGDLSLDMILMYFESKRRSGGGPIAKHKLVKPGVVHITFEQSTIVKHVSTRQHIWEKQPLGVSLMEERDPEPDTIEISGFTSSISSDVLELYFENHRKSGGGEILNSGMNEDKTKFTIKFSDEKVVEDVLGQKHELSSCKLVVNRPGKEIYHRQQGKRLSRVVSTHFENEQTSLTVDNSVCILVTFDEEKMELDMLLLYFESVKHSSGGVISKSNLHQPGNVIIKFSEIGVAENVSRRSHNWQGQHLDVSLIEETDPAPNTVEVSECFHMIGEETLEMYFENTNRSGGGKIVSSKMSEDESKFIVTFENEQIVKRVLAKDHKISKCPLAVKRPNKEWKFKDSVDKSVLEVHGAEENITEEILEMYFESPKSGGNGKEVNAEYDKDKSVWTIRFSSSEVADSVLKKPNHKWNIKVLRPQPKGKVFNTIKPNAKKAKQQEDDETVPLIVENVKSSISEDYLRLYFESKNKSGGGPIALMQKNQKVPDSWIIHFQQNRVAEAVVKHKHELCGGLTVKLGTKQVKRPIKKNCLLITDLPKPLDEDVFDLYLEKMTSMNNPRVEFGKDPTKAMVTYADPINDIDMVISKIKEQKLSGVTIDARKVFDVDTVIVKNLNKSCTEEMLMLYFENPSRSGGGPIQELYIDKERQEGKIQFENYKAVKSVCNMKHELQKKDLEMCLYYDEIGEVVSDGSQWIPDPVSVKVDPYLLTFACKNQEFMNELSAAGIQMEYNEACDVVKLHVGSELDLKKIYGWDEYAASTFKHLCDQFDVQWLDIGDECIGDFQPYIEKAETEGVELQHHDSSLLIVGVRHIVEEVLCELSKQLDVMNDDIKRKKNIVERDENCGPVKLKKIHLLHFEETAKSKFGVDFVVDDKSSTVKFKGLPIDIDSASLCLYRDLENIVEISFICESEVSKFLLKFYDDVIHCVQKDNHLHIEYVIEENRVKVYSKSLDHAKAAKSSIEKIRCQKYPLSSDKVKVIKSAEGKEVLESFKAFELVTVGISQAKGEACIVITGFDMVVDQVINKLDDFLFTNQILEKNKPVNQGVVLLLEKHHSHEIDTMETALNAHFIKLIPKADLSCVVIRGNRSGIDKAIEKITQFERNVQTGKHLISQPGMASYFKEDKGRTALKSVENNFKCIIEVDGKFTGTESSMQVLLQHKMQGVELIICKADMTEMNVDAIVNAANDRLQHVGGLAKAIVNAGGKEIQIESDRIMSTQRGLLLSGEVVVTNAGKLPCKKVIHTVGPMYKPNQPKVKMMLMKAVTGAFEEADNIRFTSIAMSAISSGIYRYPLEPCTQIILETTKEYFKDNPRSTLQHVYFVSVDMKVCKAFESAMKSVFKVKKEEEDDFFMVEDYDDFVDLPAASGIPTISNSGLKINNDVVTPKEGFDIKLIKGKIEDSEVDVIVNTTSSDLNLTKGNVSKALLQAAGPQLQQECSAIKATNGNIPVNGFVETGPAALKCQKVFHTSSQQYQGPTSIQNIRVLLKTILSSASDMSSIAIPALGTGNLKYPADQVAKVMYEEAIDYSGNQPQSNLKEIHFVVYFKDTRTIQAFDSEINNLRSPANEEEQIKETPQQIKEDPERMYQVKQTAADHVTSSPYQHFKQLSKYQAEMEIGCVTVRIEQGDITASDADSIVNLTSSDFNLRAGAVSNAILKAGGSAIQTECKNNIKSHSEEVWTGSGRLNCGAICHLPIPRGDISQLKAMLVRILTTANNWKNETIALPAIGTGNIGKSPKEAATFIFECIQKFSKKENPTNLRKILIIVFEMPMTLEFISTMEAMQGQQPQHKGIIQRGYDYMKAKVLGTEEVTDEDANTSPQLALRILSLDEKQIKEAKSKIQSIIAEEMTNQIVHKEVFSRFTPQQIAKLNKIAGNYEVYINTQNVKSNTIELQGRPVNVMEAQRAIFDLTDKIHEAEKEKELILKDVKWFYLDDKDDMVEFGGHITVLLEKGYPHNKKEITFTSNKHTYKVNLNKMEGTDLKLKKTFRVIRKEFKAGMSLPPNWSPMKENEHLKVEEVKPGSNEYELVEAEFTTSLKTEYQPQSIDKISRIQNIELWKQYAAKKETFEKTMPSQAFEQVLYHGTDDGTIEKINIGGFNRSYAGKNATYYGQGTYFATSAGYSARDKYSVRNANGQKHIYMCHVLVGKCTQGKPDMLAPPDGFHSVCNDPNNPQIIVIFNDVQAYSSYLITFK